MSNYQFAASINWLEKKRGFIKKIGHGRPFCRWKHSEGFGNVKIMLNEECLW